jgi:cbb3-type cytochrome oxidase cytochrome c subunit/cytochrome c5
MTTQRANYLYPALGLTLILASIIFVVVLVPRWTFKPPEPKDLRDYTAQELRGRETYKEEGCWYCHSNVSRPQDWDHGPRSKSSDYYYDEYHLVGSERSGPDLANIGGKFPDQYHILHHKNPRYVKPGSIMPRYDYLSDQELTDLTAFLQSLGPYGTRALDVKDGKAKYETSGETKWARVRDFTWKGGPLDGVTEKVAVWKLDVAQQRALNEELYGEHLEVPFKYTAEIEELMYGSSHEAANAKGALQALATPAFTNREALEAAREADPEVKAWTENNFKEGVITEKNRLLANYGKGMFNNLCSPCHAVDANGMGQAAFTMTKRPANFWEDRFATYTTDTWYWRISRGVPGTQMPRWEYTLDANQRLTLAAFLKYVATNKGLGKLQGSASNYDQPPAPATQAKP